MIIAVDFDGTIVTHAYPKIGREMPGAISTLKRIQADGHRLILWTVREGELLDEAVEYCRERGLEFFAVNEHYVGENYKQGGTEGKSCRKINADLYIDDRNIGGFPGWEAIYEMLSHRLSFAGYYSQLTGSRHHHRNDGFLHRLFNKFSNE